MTTGRRLARNSALNLVGQALPIVVAIVAIPPLVRGLGAERFGVLTLVWAAIGYFSLFELGLSRALTQAVAQRLGSGNADELAELSWSALLLLLGLGIFGGIVLVSLSSVLVTQVLNIRGELRDESLRAFWILAATLPFVVTSVGLRGLMEAHQHFGAATVLRVPLVAFMFIGPLLVLPFSNSLVPAVWMLAAGRLVGFVTHLVYCLRTYRFLQSRPHVKRESVIALLRFGGWTTVSNVVSPIMVFMDRFFVGALLPLAAVAHYVTPYEVVVKLLVVPVALLGATLPAFASAVGANPNKMAHLYERSLRSVVLVTFPLVLVAVALANEGLFLWVGPVLPHESAIVLQWLAVGVFINGIAQAPLTALQSAAKPDVIAKLHVAELPLYAFAILLLTRRLGLQGVAIAWTLRVTVDCVALLWLARRHLGLSPVPKFGGVWWLAAMLVALGAGAALTSTVSRLLYVLVMVGAFAPAAWYMMLTSTERAGLKDWARRPQPLSQDGPETLA